MQNFCHNRLTVFADDADQIINFISAVAGPDQPLDFEKIAPVPAILDKVAMGLQPAGNARDALVVVPAYFEEAPDGSVEERPLTEAEWDAYRRVGYLDDQAWLNANWGCQTTPTDCELEQGETSAIYFFTTDDTPPKRIVQTLRELFPTLQIVAFFDEPVMRIGGYY
jgi:hypothetical protein